MQKTSDLNYMVCDDFYVFDIYFELNSEKKRNPQLPMLTKMSIN